jgi:diguanylate cyclase (GGDEF)-like protein
LAGSGALAQIARLLGCELGPDDLLAKYGGDEFCVLLPERSEVQARMIADALRAAVRAHSFDGEAGQRLSVSVGLAGPSEGAASAKQLLLEVDALLFRAKAEGRDRTVAAEELLSR